jgi:hypothetical protein
MNIKVRQIEVDAETAAALEARAAEVGLSVRELLAEMVCLEKAPAKLSGGELRDLDRMGGHQSRRANGCPRRCRSLA